MHCCAICGDRQVVGKEKISAEESKCGRELTFYLCKEHISREDLREKKVAARMDREKLIMRARDTA